MTDRRPDCVYGILARDGRVFLRRLPEGWGLPGGTFPPMADHRKNELRGLLWDQLGIDAGSIWAQGAFDYRNPDEETERFSGFYTVWEWDGEVPEDAGAWVGAASLSEFDLPASLRILLLSVLSMETMRTS
jgi:hypothetical protein